MSKASPFFFSSDGGALLLNKRNFCLTVFCLIIATLWNTSSVFGAPAKLDSLESPFPLDLQPPVFEAASSATNGDNSDGKTIDSYGNPIESLQPIETPDGRKVVSAQGLQFEIPNYASGITELKKPSDDLLPPFVGELSNDLVKIPTTATTATTSVNDGQNNNNNNYDDNQGKSKDNDVDDSQNSVVYNFETTAEDLSRQVIDDTTPLLWRFKRQLKQEPQNYQDNTDIKHNSNSNTTNNPNTNTSSSSYYVANTTTNKPNQLSNDHQTLNTPSSYSSSSPSTSSSVTNSLTLLVSKQAKSYNLNSLFITPSSSSPPSSSSSPAPSSDSPFHFINSLQSPSSNPKLSAQYAPISNGNFNYPNVPTDLSIIDRIASKYKNPLPTTIDPIVVALPDGSPDTFASNAGSSSFSSAPPPPSSSSSAETTTVDVESIPLVEVETDSSTAHSSKNNHFVPSLGNFQGLPEYILDLNDPNIGGPVDYVPDNKGLKVIAWDLLPPYETNVEVEDNVNREDAQIITAENSTPRTITGVEDPVSHNIKVTLSTGLNPQTSAGQVSVVDVQPQYSETSQTIHKPVIIGSRGNAETTTKPNYTQQSRGSVYYSSTTTTQKPQTTTTRRTTTTTQRTTTTPRTTITTTPKTTTTRRTTTPRSTSTTTTTTTPEPDSSEFFKLEAGDSYTLPPWLQDIDDPELDVAVTYIVPEDINEYNHTIDRDILPPFEPYTDLNNIHLTPPSTYVKETTTNIPKITTTTTPKPTTTTTRRTTTTTSTTFKPTTTTTTRRPTLSTSQPHWVRAKPTTRPTTQSTFNNQFATSFNHNQDTDNQHVPSIASSNFAQNTRTTSTTTVKPKTTVNYYNRPLSNTPKTDKITSSEERQPPQKSQNPFLPTYNNGAYRPQTTTRRPTTTTTTTTTTTAAPEVYENPFEATIPPWLKDFDYADVGPGVPFVYDPNDDESPVDKDILPPSETSETNPKPAFITSPSLSSSFVNSQTPQGFTNKFSTSATSLISSSSIPSKVTIPLPSIQKPTTTTTNQDDDSTGTQPPLVFVPPPPTAAEDIIANTDDASITKKTSSSFNNNFPAPFDPTTSSTSSDDTKKVTLGADRESFPPFNNAIAGDVTGSAVPSKTTFSKSEDGKVITNNVFLNGGTTGAGTSSTKPFATSTGGNNEQKGSFATQSSTQFGAQTFSGSTFTKATTASTNFNQFGTTSSGASGFVTSGAAGSSSFGSTAFGSSSSAGGSKYTGRFGGPPGLLAPQGSGFTSAGFTTASPVTKNYNRPAATTSSGFASPSSSASSTSSNNHKFTGSFGGPPGVLTPYDNVKNRN